MDERRYLDERVAAGSWGDSARCGGARASTTSPGSTRGGSGAAIVQSSGGRLSGLDLLVAWVAHDRLHLCQLAGTLARLWANHWTPLRAEYAGPIPYPVSRKRGRAASRGSRSRRPGAGRGSWVRRTSGRRGYLTASDVGPAAGPLRAGARRVAGERWRPRTRRRAAAASSARRRRISSGRSVMPRSTSVPDLAGGAAMRRGPRARGRCAAGKVRQARLAAQAVPSTRGAPRGRRHRSPARGRRSPREGRRHRASVLEARAQIGGVHQGDGVVEGDGRERGGGRAREDLDEREVPRSHGSGPNHSTIARSAGRSRARSISASATSHHSARSRRCVSGSSAHGADGAAIPPHPHLAGQSGPTRHRTSAVPAMEMDRPPALTLAHRAARSPAAAGITSIPIGALFQVVRQRSRAPRVEVQARHRIDRASPRARPSAPRSSGAGSASTTCRRGASPLRTSTKSPAAERAGKREPELEGREAAPLVCACTPGSCRRRRGHGRSPSEKRWMNAGGAAKPCVSTSQGLMRVARRVDEARVIRGRRLAVSRCGPAVPVHAVGGAPSPAAARERRQRRRGGPHPTITTRCSTVVQSAPSPESTTSCPRTRPPSSSRDHAAPDRAGRRRRAALSDSGRGTRR